MGTVLKIRLDWSEMDMLGHINNVSFFKYVQAARVNYWESIGLAIDINTLKIGPMLANTSCKFIKPLFYPGDITVKSSVMFIKTTSFGIHHQIYDGDGVLAAEADDVVVMYDFDKAEKVILNSTLRANIEECEGKQF